MDDNLHFPNSWMLDTMGELFQKICLFCLVQGTPRSFQEELSCPPLKLLSGASTSAYSFPLPVLYTNDQDAASEWIDRHVCERPMIIGWDTESSPYLPWRESKYLGPATVQLSTMRASMVFEIANEIEGPRPNALHPFKEILADSSVLKAGVGIDVDMLDLYRWDSQNNNGSNGDGAVRDIFGRLDIGGIGSGSADRKASLKNLARVVLELELPKSKKIARSNWAKSPLSTKQIQYASRDAWVAAAVMAELSVRDPSVFSVSAVLDSMRRREKEQTMEVMNDRAVQRKAAKEKLFGIIREDGRKDGEKIPISELSEDELKEVEVLQERRRELAPPKSIAFDISQLGLSIWDN